MFCVPGGEVGGPGDGAHAVSVIFSAGGACKGSSTPPALLYPPSLHGFSNERAENPSTIGKCVCTLCASWREEGPGCGCTRWVSPCHPTHMWRFLSFFSCIGCARGLHLHPSIHTQGAYSRLHFHNDTCSATMDRIDAAIGCLRRSATPRIPSGMRLGGCLTDS